jgi:protein-disulfide isomerase
MCAVVITGLVVRRELAPTPARTEAVIPVKPLKGWERYIAGDERIGAHDAAVTIVEFSDFQCPYCRDFAETVDTVLARYGRNVRVVFRNFPLTGIHPFARAAAIAGECAARQGRFGEFHDFSFAHQDSLGLIGASETGHRIQIGDSASFAACVTDSLTLASIRADSTAGRSLAIAGTPTVLIGGLLYHGAPTTEETVRVIDSILAAGKHK